MENILCFSVGNRIVAFVLFISPLFVIRKVIHKQHRSNRWCMIVLVYDISKRSTFLSLQRWVEEVRRYTSSHVLLVLVGTIIVNNCHTIVTLRYFISSVSIRFAGNKCDLEDLREVEKAEAEALCHYLPEVLHVVETSAKDNTNIDSIFFYLASELKVNRFSHRVKVVSSTI